MYLKNYTPLLLKNPTENSYKKCHEKVISFSIIGILLVLIVTLTLIFLSTVDHDGLDDKEKLKLSIIHSISAFCVLFAAVLLCVYIRFLVNKRRKSEHDDDVEEKGAQVNVRFYL